MVNAAVHVSRHPLLLHKLTQLREEYRQNPAPSNTQYGWVWVGDGVPTTPVGTA